jgi:hypothetical protein
MMERPLMCPDELKSLPKGHFIVTKTGVHPMRTVLKLFVHWGITFEEPYDMEEKSARKVAYADKDELTNEIVRRAKKRGATPNDDDDDDGYGVGYTANSDTQPSPQIPQILHSPPLSLPPLRERINRHGIENGSRNEIEIANDGIPRLPVEFDEPHKPKTNDKPSPRRRSAQRHTSPQPNELKNETNDKEDTYELH